jgi:hypothetical protein
MNKSNIPPCPMGFFEKRMVQGSDISYKFLPALRFDKLDFSAIKLVALKTF